MGCENEGHSGAKDHHNPPEYRCLYCGRWGYASHWYDEEKTWYEECDCELSYHDHCNTCD